jgi:hypothetical protein
MKYIEYGGEQIEQDYFSIYFGTHCKLKGIERTTCTRKYKARVLPRGKILSLSSNMIKIILLLLQIMAQLLMRMVMK